MNIAQPTQVLIEAYPYQSKLAALKAPATLQLAIYMARAFNNSGSSNDTGIVRLFNSQAFQLYTFDGTSTYTQVSNSPSAGAPQALFATSVASNGFVVQSKTRSGIISFTISQSGASGVYVYEYWNGSAWATLTTLNTATFTAAGDNVIAFLPPNDWVTGGPLGLNSSYFSIRLRATTAPATSVQISLLAMGALLEFYPSIANNTGVVLDFDVLHPLILEANEGIMPYFKTANSQNGMTIAYTTT